MLFPLTGKKGESVRQITRASGAIIKIAAENKEGDKTEDGPTENNNNATGAILDPKQPIPPRDASKTPGEKSVAITASFDAQCRAIAQIFKKLYEERFFGNDPPFLALDLVIPSSQMGKVLGKQKLKIRTIERRTGVNIRVPENKSAAAVAAAAEHAAAGGVDAQETHSAPVMTKAEYDDSMSYVTIRGSLTQMIQAMTMIKEILVHGELPPMGGGGGFHGGPPHPYHPHQHPHGPPPPHMYPQFHRNPYSYHHNNRGNRGRARF